MLLRTHGPDVASQATLYLIVGGLFMLGVILALVLVRSVFPIKRAKDSISQRASVTRRMAPWPTREVTSTPGIATTSATDLAGPLRLPAPARPQDMDGLVQAASREGKGTLRYLRVQGDQTVVRVFECPDCGDEPGQGCHAPANFLKEAFAHIKRHEATVREIRCGRGGICDFEVTH